MKRLNIGIDLDGVLADLVGAAVKEVNLRRGLSLTKEDVKEWSYLVTDLGFTRDEQRRIFNRIWRNHRISLGLEELDLVRYLGQLRIGNFITIISHRHIDAHQFVVPWLVERNLLYDSLVFADPGEDKFDYPIEVLIDDHPGMVLKAKKHPEKLLLLRDQPWNKDLTKVLGANFGWPSNVERLFSLSQARKQIEVWAQSRRKLG